MDLNDIISSIPSFLSWSHADKIRFFAWFLYSKRGQESFKPADILGCYNALHMEPPSAISPFLIQMEKRKPKEVLRNSHGYILERRLRDELDAKYGQRVATVQADKLLSDLAARVPNLAERGFLDEAVKCFRAKAFRAAIVMAWNLAYDHLCYYVLDKHLASFNTQWPKSFPKKHANARVSAIVTREDFGELQESEVIQICRSASIISNDIYKILHEKLGRRNTAAHPCSVVIAPHTAEEFIIDLISNIVLKLV